MINGGNKAYNDLETKPAWLKKFKKELDMIHAKFAEDREFELHKKKREKLNIEFNHEASYMNVKLCDYENKILMTIWQSLGKPRDCVLCFDGIMVKGTAFDLPTLEKAVHEELNIKIQLAVKNMDQAFTLGEVAPYEEPKPSTSFDFEDPYTYQKFQNEFKERKFSSLEEAHDILSPIYPKVIGRVLRGEGSYIKKLEEGHVDVVKKLGASDFNINISSMKPSKMKFSEYLFRQDGFANYACKLEGCKPCDFNLWSGFGAKRTENKPEGLELMKKFVLETWASGNQEHYNYIMSWFTGLLTNTKGINMVALAMIAKQGTGKGFFLTFMKYILRAVNVAEVAGIGPITQKHNTVMQNKRLVVINEMSSTKDEFKSNFDKIKTYITDPVISIEPKGVNPYQIDNISNFLLFTNHQDAIIVEESDRRYAIFEMADIHRNDTAYFDMLESKCFNQEVANAFYTSLLDFPAMSIRSIPNTELRQEMINLSKSTPVKFLDAVQERDMFDGEKEINATTFYQKYVDWCRENGERNTYTSTKFGTCLKGKIEKKKTRIGMVYVIN